MQRKAKSAVDTVSNLPKYWEVSYVPSGLSGPSPVRITSPHLMLRTIVTKAVCRLLFAWRCRLHFGCEINAILNDTFYSRTFHTYWISYFCPCLFPRFLQTVILDNSQLEVFSQLTESTTNFLISFIVLSGAYVKVSRRLNRLIGFYSYFSLIKSVTNSYSKTEWRSKATNLLLRPKPEMT